MRFDKLTTKFQQALADAQSTAARADHPYIEPVHVLAALLADTESGASSLLARAGVAVNKLQPALKTALAALPQVQSGDGNVQISRELQSVLTRTDKEAAKRATPSFQVNCFCWRWPMTKARLAVFCATPVYSERRWNRLSRRFAGART